MMKLLVYGVYTIETIQTILITHDAHEGYARGFGNLAALDSAHYEWLAVPILSGIGMLYLCFSQLVLNCSFLVSCIVQLFYAYRVWLLSRSPWISGVIAGVCRRRLWCSHVLNSSCDRSHSCKVSPPLLKGHRHESLGPSPGSRTTQRLLVVYVLVHKLSIVS